MASLYSSNTALRVPQVEEEVDPMSTVANIADAMLVFACGLMVALVVAWNVDLRNVQEVELDSSEQVEDVQSLEDLLSAEGSSYIERGTVYQDPRTGQMYLLEGDAESAGDAADVRDAEDSEGAGDTGDAAGGAAQRSVGNAGASGGASSGEGA